MSDLAIRIEGLGKKYRLRHDRQPQYTALRDVIADTTRRLLNPRHARNRPAPVEDFWALRQVSCEIRQGEVIGVIGRNGAGKSTLLKIISRITEPSEGRVEIDGRVASMLEVGTGFHPELTGRENIYLNGAILGMRRADIRRRFDEIVAFADIERFLDTPVKRFSSGMYMRLAFAVAAHLETENLIVDEVLAVGDAEFQRKCLGKMSEVARSGRTVLFVSHNMAAIRRLTQRCLLLDAGRLLLEAPADAAIERYLAQAADGLANGIFVRAAEPADRPFWVRRVTTRHRPGTAPANRFDCDDPICVSIEYVARRRIRHLQGSIQFQRTDGTLVCESDSRDSGSSGFDTVAPGEGSLTIAVPPRLLGPGAYQIALSFTSPFDPAGPELDNPGMVGEFVLDDTRTPRGNHRRGYISTILQWQAEAAATDIIDIAAES